MLSAGIAAAQSPAFLPSVAIVAGSRANGYTGDGGSAVSAKLSNTLTSVATDPFGNIYVADLGNFVVRRIDAVTGIITTVAGNGTTGSTGDGGPATLAQLARPGSVRYYQSALYIADGSGTGSGVKIRKVDLVTGIISTLCSAIGPQDITIDAFGNLYFTQLGGKPFVEKIVLGSGATTAVPYAGTGTTGYSGDGSPATSAMLSGPNGIITDAQGNLYIADAGNKVIRRVDYNTKIITTYAGGATTVCAGATDTYGDGCPALQAMFGTMTQLSIDPSGALYIADNTNNLIRKVAAGSNGTAGTVTLVAGTGTTPSGVDGSYALNTAFGGPYDVAFTPAGDLLVSEKSISSVRVIRVASTFPSTAVGLTSASVGLLALTQTGTGTVSLPSGTDFMSGSSPTCSAGVKVTGSVCSFSLSFKPSLAGARSAPLIFADTNGSIKQGVNALGLAPAASLLPGLITTFAGTGTAGASGQNVAATSAQLNAPTTAAFDGQGNLYLVDTGNNEIRKISSNGIITLVAGTGALGSSGDGGAATSATLNAPQGIAVDAAGNLYIADTGNNKIRFVDTSTGLISTLAGTGTAGYTGDYGTAAAATFNHPSGLFITPAGVLYMADTGNNVVRMIGLHSTMVTTFAGTGTAGSLGDGANSALAQLSAPQGVAADASGNVYIADTGNNKIREVNPVATISTIVGQATAGFNGDGQASTAQLSAPTGLILDSAGNLYMSDSGNNRVRVISGGQIVTIAGTGTAAATGDGASSDTAAVSSPHGVALDALGNLYILDTGNNKVREISTNSNILSFAATNPGDTTPAKTISVYNSGNQSLAVSSVSVPSGFVEQASTSGTDCASAPLALTAGSSCALHTAFHPSALGPYSGSITITDNAESVSGAQQIINVSGTSAYVFAAGISLPATSTSGSVITANVAVTNPALIVYTGTLHFTSTDAHATLPSDYAFSSSDAGAHAFTLTLRTAGVQCVTVTDTTNSTLTASGCVNVSPGAPTLISAFQGNNQIANVSSSYSSQLVALVTDTAGNPVPNVNVTFTVNPNGAAYGVFGSSSQSTDVEPTNSSGYATSAALTAGSAIGSYTVTASATGVSATATFNLSVAVGFTITPTSTQVGPLQPGISNTQPLTITGLRGFNAPVTLTCSAPAGITCTVYPTLVPFTNGQPVLTSGLPTLSVQSQGILRGTAMPSPAMYIPLFVLTGLGCIYRRRKLSLLLILVAIGAGSIGCGQGYTPPITPNGTYSVTVTGTAQSVSTSTTVQYTISSN
jgi:sugar lactone lactonase YvrE